MTAVGKAYAYVSPKTGNDFERYAGACGLTSQSELLKLLIARELKLRRLPHSRDLRAGSRQAPLPGRKKITAHLQPGLDDPFSRHIGQLGLSTSCAAAMLVEAELSEQWLASAIEWKPKRSKAVA